MLFGRPEQPYVNPYVGGALLGVVLFLAFFLTGNGLGASGGLNRYVVYLEDLVAPEHIDRLSYLLKMAGGEKNPLDDWIVFLTFGTLIGGFVSGWMHGRLKVETNKGPNISVRTRWLAAFVGGTIMGYGARFARGCTSGQALSGGAVLDLHIHDADFILHCFGPPTRVSARGVIGPRGGIDHVLATYEYPNGPALVAAEGGWMPGDEYPFTMRYRVRFEEATAVFELGAETPLRVHRDGAGPEAIAIPSGTGYDGEVAHFLDCIEHRRPPSVVTLADGARAVALIEAERRSVREAAPVPFDPA
ncbi:MAG: YeeE/YedE family protein [Caldilineaceae bacterium]|nr:YeeE/YedE family protein [Caldilineaceae bacterium]